MLNFLQLPGSKRPSLNLDTESRQRLHPGGDRFPFDGTANPFDLFAHNPQENPPLDRRVALNHKAEAPAPALGSLAYLLTC